MASAADLALLRLVAQRIAGPGWPSAAGAARWLTAVQAQDYPGAVTSLALRTRARTRAGVLAALTEGTVVRSWPMRGTLHFVAAEDLNWILERCGPRMIAVAASRRAEVELDAAALQRAGQVAANALAGGRGLRRAELLAVWERAGLATGGQRGYHLIVYLAQTGLLCFGPVRDGEQCLVLLEEWVPNPRRPQRDEALGELAVRYFRSHGPATIKDFGNWTKLVAADLRIGLAIARPELERLEVDGVEYLMDPRTPARLQRYRDAARGIHLLPGFDEFMLGYTSRAVALPTEFSERIAPGGNGMFRPTVVAGGQVVGTWRMAGKPAARTLEATAFTTFTSEVEAALAPLTDAL